MKRIISDRPRDSVDLTLDDILEHFKTQGKLRLPTPAGFHTQEPISNDKPRRIWNLKLVKEMYKLALKYCSDNQLTLDSLSQQDYITIGSHFDKSPK